MAAATSSTASNIPARHRHVLFRLKGELYAFPVGAVREMVRSQPAALVPGSKPHVRGVINLRGTILPLIDLRVLLGMPSAAAEVAELCDMLVARQKDHEAWLAELERCARTGDRFTKATDPHSCAFGKWYDTFQTEHMVLRSELARLDAPHKAIHAIAKQVLELASTGRQREAIELIERKRATELVDLTRTLNNVRSMVRDQQRELVIVVDEDRQSVGICVDGIEGVEELSSETTDLSATFGASLKLVQHMVLRSGSGQPVRVVDTRRLLREGMGVSTAI